MWEHYKKGKKYIVVNTNCKIQQEDIYDDRTWVEAVIYSTEDDVYSLYVMSRADFKEEFVKELLDKQLK